jgi:type 1 glutamine amidotransferase
MPAIRVTLLTDSKGFVHDVVKPRAEDGTTLVQRAFEELAMASGGRLEVSTLTNARDVTAERLARTDVLALYTSGDITFPGRGVADIDAWVRNGGGLLGVHAATTTLQKDPAFVKILGGRFNGHPWGANESVTLKVHDPHHPVVAMWPTGLAITEEIYWHLDFDPTTVRVLMSLDMQRTPLKRAQHVPIVWCKQYGNGRVLYTSLGHREDVWASDRFRAHLVAAIGWTSGNIDGDATPNPELSLEEQRLAEQACTAGTSDA